MDQEGYHMKMAGVFLFVVLSIAVAAVVAVVMAVNRLIQSDNDLG